MIEIKIMNSEKKIKKKFILPAQFLDSIKMLLIIFEVFTDKKYL